MSPLRFPSPSLPATPLDSQPFPRPRSSRPHPFDHHKIISAAPLSVREAARLPGTPTCADRSAVRRRWRGRHPFHNEEIYLICGGSSSHRPLKHDWLAPASFRLNGHMAGDGQHTRLIEPEIAGGGSNGGRQPLKLEQKRHRQEEIDVPAQDGICLPPISDSGSQEMTETRRWRR